jgi:hypothetical protein
MFIIPLVDLHDSLLIIQFEVVAFEPLSMSMCHKGMCIAKGSHNRGSVMRKDEVPDQDQIKGVKLKN